MAAIKWYKLYDFKLDGDNPQDLNTVRTVDINNKYLCIARNNEGYFAVDDKCPHAGARLGMGICDEGFVVCPVHRYKYNLKTGKGLPQQGDFVNTYPVKQTETGIYIGFEKKDPLWFAKGVLWSLGLRKTK